jgi:hypothetical protein
MQTDFLRNLQSATESRLVFSWSSVSSRFFAPTHHPLGISHTRLGLYHITSGPGPRSQHALAARITHAIQRATPSPAHSSPARSHPPHTARPARHPRLLAAMPFGRPLVPLHDAQSCAHSTHRLRRSNTASPQVASHLAIPHCTDGPNTPHLHRIY